MILARAPYRIPLAGGGTDIDFYYKKKGGLLISAALNQYVYTIFKKRDLDNKVLVQTTTTEFENSIHKIKHKIIREVFKYFKISQSFQISTFSTIPTQSGLGSSSSLVVSLIKNICRYKKIKLSNKKIVKIAYHIERKILKNDGGWQDQIVSTYGGLIKIKINKNGEFNITNLKIKKHIKKKIERNLILVFTNEVRKSADIITSQRRSKKKSNQIYIYDELKKKVTEIEKALINGNIKMIGETFDDHWKLKKKLSKKISNSILDKIYLKMMKTDLFYGGKIIGAGGGGFFLMALKKKKAEVKSFLSKNKFNFINLEIDNKGACFLTNI
tara:strand:- start:1762 stop:2745 length:984 start_codon:yes stop_codon:yes gene_type:complete